MGRQRQSDARTDDLDDDDLGDDPDALLSDLTMQPANRGMRRMRDWRDVERLREERALRELIDDDLLRD